MMYVKADCDLEAFLGTPLTEVLATIRGFQNLEHLVHRDNPGQSEALSQQALRLNGEWNRDAPPTRKFPTRGALPSHEEFHHRVMHAVGPRWNNPDPAITTKLVMVGLVFRVPRTSSPSSSAGAPSTSYEDVGHSIAIRREGNLCRIFDPNLGEASQIPVERLRTLLEALLSHYVMWSLVGWTISVFRR